MRKSLIVLALVFLGACATEREEAGLNATPQPAAPQPDAAKLQDGLATHYYASAFDHIDELIDWTDYRDGQAGEPISGLSHRAGKGDVLTSGSSDRVGAVISGQLRIPEPGTYQLSVTVNDGARIYLGGALVHDDPKVGPDRTVESQPFQIGQAGWYPIKIWYYEKRGGSTLDVQWKTPGDAAFAAIPSEDLKH